MWYDKKKMPHRVESSGRTTKKGKNTRAKGPAFTPKQGAQQKQHTPRGEKGKTTGVAWLNEDSLQQKKEGEATGEVYKVVPIEKGGRRGRRLPLRKN